MSDQLPSFDRPPLIETVLGVQFAPVDGLSSAHLGLFWREIGPEWTRVQEGEPVGQILLDEGAGGVFSPDSLSNRARRLKFLDASSSRMVQVENGWLIYNWRRRAPGDAYPRFETLLPEFQRVFRALCAFLVSQGFGEPKINLWEVCYVNDIAKGTVWNTPQGWPELFPCLLAAPSLSQVGAPLTASARWRFPIVRAHASLEVVLNHVADGDGSTEILRLTQLARGSAGNLAGLEQGLHDGHRAIVHTFAEITSVAAHRQWGRTR